MRDKVERSGVRKAEDKRQGRMGRRNMKRKEKKYNPIKV